MNCRDVKAQLADLLLDPASAATELRTHVEACADCRKELRDLQATMQLLNAWEAPEPSPFFDAKLRGRLRRERDRTPAGLWERVRTRMLFGSNLHLRPLAAGALAALLAVGGGTAFWVEHSPSRVQESATVRDLQSLDGNAQVFQQLNALDTDEDNGGGSTAN